MIRAVCTPSSTARYARYPLLSAHQTIPTVNILRYIKYVIGFDNRDTSQACKASMFIQATINSYDTVCFKMVLRTLRVHWLCCEFEIVS
jgi:hypothetical protein